MNSLNPCEIASNDLMWRSKEECEDESTDHQDKESDIRSIIDTPFSRVPVLSDRNSRSYDGTQIKNGPKVSDISTLLLLGRIGHHDSSLRSPEEGSTNTKYRAGGNYKSVILGMII